MVKGLDRFSLHIAVAQMGALGVVKHKPFIQIGLQFFQCQVKILTEYYLEEFFLKRPMKTLHKTIGLCTSDLGNTVVGVVNIADTQVFG